MPVGVLTIEAVYIPVCGSTDQLARNLSRKPTVRKVCHLWEVCGEHGDLLIRAAIPQGEFLDAGMKEAFAMRCQI
jgi:hypothetical protein